jgi:competence protein ComEA
VIRMSASLMVIVACLVAARPHAQTAQAKPESRAQAAQAAPKPIVPMLIVNLNTATLKELEVLPGVGTKTAERIIEYRVKKGPFKKVEELMNVQGIGEKSFLKLKPQLTVAVKAESNTP